MVPRKPGDRVKSERMATPTPAHLVSRRSNAEEQDGAPRCCINVSILTCNIPGTRGTQQQRRYWLDTHVTTPLTQHPHNLFFWAALFFRGEVRAARPRSSPTKIFFHPTLLHLKCPCRRPSIPRRSSTMRRFSLQVLHHSRHMMGHGLTSHLWCHSM